ncbi:RNA polymerase sigma factor SigZ [Candidatus Sororendozoicomonas aggregata]|uniref:RNA polymerase sigma factor SigZ n=1 Tax=Candidatus Sororendozoicomonas aggregata TaxID=3073239 RepID=UPI002ED20963
MKIEDIWQQYRGLLLKFLSSKVSNQADVDDLLQTILIKVHKGLASLSDATSLKPWLMQIANHAIIDFYRQQASQKPLSATNLWYENDAEKEHELAKCVKPFIDCLDSESAHLLWQADIEGVSQKQLAEKHSMNYSTLKSRVQKARKDLKALFDQCCQFELDALGNAIGCTMKADSCSSC